MLDYNFLNECYQCKDVKVDMEEFQRLKKEKLVFIRRHPSLPLNIMVYTPKAKFERKWTKELLIARGLVVGDDGEILARPLPKFFNDFEISGSLPSGPIEVYEKMDGSLIVMFFFNGEPIFSTKGTFTSEQAAKAQEIFKQKYKDLKLDQEYTYCFEVIYPENKIIVNYESEEDIFLIAKIHTKTGKQESIHDLGFRTVKQFPTVDGIDKMQELKELDKENEEGFVIKFENNFRVKLKFETYFKLHRAHGYTEHQIWTLLEKGDDIPIKHLSEEETESMKTLKNVLMDKFEIRKAELTKEYEAIKQSSKGGKDTIDQIKKSSYPGALFCFDKGKNCDRLIWRAVKPSG
eukprot:GFUD01007254.1.p1 GENE.GFUD01007254.1~~GFUD01007254.1.p1  ORF type:complete len:348 (-),score=95.39 GFUD01007254.1:1111-2154(-)